MGNLLSRRDLSSSSRYRPKSENEQLANATRNAAKGDYKSPQSRGYSIACDLKSLSYLFNSIQSAHAAITPTLLRRLDTITFAGYENNDHNTVEQSIVRNEFSVFGSCFKVELLS